MTSRALLFLLAGLILSGCKSDAYDRAARFHQDMPLAGANNAFAAKLYGELAKADSGNLFFSPLSISTCLSMALAGARGETAAEMVTALSLNGIGDVPKASAELLSALNNAQQSDDAIKLSIANSLWVQKGFKIKAAFNQTVRSQYFAEAFPTDFSQSAAATQRINKWVVDQTQDRVPKLFFPGDIDANTVMALVNAVYFKGMWAHPFDKKHTVPAPFYLDSVRTTNAAFMQREYESKGRANAASAMLYTETRHYQVLGMPYRGGSLMMAILLPRERDGLRALEDSIAAGLLGSVFQNMGTGWYIEIKLPKFKFGTYYNLVPTLENLGMRRAFRDDAEFGNIADVQMWIDKAKHAAFIEVDELGTEAAAATGMTTVLSLPQAVQFIADHPFVFVIRETVSGEILFMGRVMNPAE